MDAWTLFREADDDYFTEEALNQLVKEQDVAGIYNLAGHYYKLEHYDLALKYYEMAAELGESNAVTYIGDIWRNGYTGTVDYEKAYLCYSSNAAHNTLSTIRIADMYRDGCYVEQNYEKYSLIIEELFERYLDGSYLYVAIPDILSRMAGIFRDWGDNAKAVFLFREAKAASNEQMPDNPKVEDLRRMEEIVNGLYSLTDIDVDKIDLFDCYYVLKTPRTVSFFYNGMQYDVQSVINKDGISILFGGKWYRTAEDFLRKAVIEENGIISIRNELYDFGVKENGTR